MSSHVISDSSTLQFRAGGFCKRCGTSHTLGAGNTLRHGTELIARLEQEKTITLFSENTDVNPDFSTEYLFGPPRGKMFGILECRDSMGNSTYLYAFSGQYNGHWNVEGWVPPLIDIKTFTTLTRTADVQIKALTGKLAITSPATEEYRLLKRERRTLSRTLMEEILNLYTLRNFRGEQLPLCDAFSGPHGIPTGTGDCCAPKLLQFAAQHNLRPVGLSEFFFGKATRSGSYQHGNFSLPCKEKCSPILGFMLCGLKEVL